MQKSENSLIFSTEGEGACIVCKWEHKKDMQVDESSFDEVSGELNRHTPDPKGVSSLCLLEIKKDSHVVNKFYGNPAQGVITCQKMLFNPYIMVPGSKKKERVQVHFCKLGGRHIVLPVEKDADYTLVLCAKAISHYVTRVGDSFKMMLAIESCTINTIFTNTDTGMVPNIEDIHNSLFVQRTVLNPSSVQYVGTVKITMGVIHVDRYCEKFMTAMLFIKLSEPIQKKYRDIRQLRGTSQPTPNTLCTTLKCPDHVKHTGKNLLTW